MTRQDNGQTPKGVFPQRTDVLVVGAGPTGLSLACDLARRGIDHVVIDHAPQVATYSQAALVDARTLEALDRIGASAPLVRRGVMATHFSLRDRDDELLAADFSGLAVRHPYLVMVPESSAEGVLSERLASYGSSVLRPVTAVSMQQNAEGVTVELWDGSTPRSESPSRRSVFARYVVGCDGMHSQVRSALQIPFVGSAKTESFVMADVRMRYPLPRSEVQLFFSGTGLLIVAPLPDDRYRIVATVDHADDPDIDGVQALLATRGPQSSPAIVHEVLWSAGFSIHHRLAMHYRSGRVFLAGDAAHVHSPASGQGMNAGIQDALHLSDRLSDVLAGLAADSVLNRYEIERRSVAESVIRLTGRLSGIATMRGRMGRRIRNQSLRVLGRLSVFRQSLANRLAGFDHSSKSENTRREPQLPVSSTPALRAHAPLVPDRRPTPPRGPA
jgi:2-polyprenyl-6-methoxyphenol hydroxylase-like FAD-dependent oxidoreductase